MVQVRYLEVERDKGGEEVVVHILLKCPETTRLREHLRSRKWQIINEEVA
jgi:hypothetical protein